MPNAPRVSVITIFLDAERFIAEAIESVRGQTFESWELILVDDGSHDASSRIAREYAAREPERIRMVEHPGHENRGMSVSRNLGVSHARGSVIALLDADDVYLPEKLERQIALLDSRPDVGAVYGATQYWYSWSGASEDQVKDRQRRQGVAAGTVVRPPTLLASFLNDSARTPTTCGIVMRRDAFDRAGGFEARFRGMFEDQVFFYKLFATSSVLVDGGCYDRYRQHPESWCHQARERGEWDGSEQPSDLRRHFLEWLGAYLDEQGIDDRELRAEWRRQMSQFTNPLAYRVATLAAKLRGRRTPPAP